MAKGFEIPQIPPEQQTPLIGQLTELIEQKEQGSDPLILFLDIRA